MQPGCGSVKRPALIKSVPSSSFSVQTNRMEMDTDLEDEPTQTLQQWRPLVGSWSGGRSLPHAARRPCVKWVVFVPVEGLTLLGAYEDSEEEDAGDSHRSAANSQNNQPADIDSTLANFMAVSILSIQIFKTHVTGPLQSMFLKKTLGCICFLLEWHLLWDVLVQTRLWCLCVRLSVFLLLLSIGFYFL